jgi:inner membrane protein
VATYVAGPYAALALRRGLTHGWPALVVLPFLVAACVLAWDRWVRRRRSPLATPARAGPVLALAAVGVLSHPTLDWMNTYGMRWAVPFDGTWSYRDALFIIDPWIWLVLGGAVVLTTEGSRAWWVTSSLLAVAASALVLVALPAARIPWILGATTIVSLRASGRPDTPQGRRALATTAACSVCVYVGVLAAADRVARAQVELAAEARGLEPRDVMVAPVRGNPFSSDVEVVTPEGYVPGVHRWIGAPSIELFPERSVPFVDAPSGLSPAAVEELLRRAREQADVRHYLVWSRYPYARIRGDGAGWEVLYADARYDGVAEAGSLGGVRAYVPATP